jgi:zinc transport system permease protein
MDILIEMLQYPFMQRAFLAGGMVSILLGWLGVFVTARHMSMVGDGIAHASLFFIALGIVLGVYPLTVAVIGAVLLGAGIYALSTYTNVTSDMSTGIVFTGGMALGIVVLQLHDGYVPELMSFLFGNVLAIRPEDIRTIAIGTLLIVTLLVIKRQQLTFLTLDPEGASLAGVRIRLLDLLFHIIVAVAVVLSVKLIGIILVSALLIIPSAIGRRFAKRFIGLQQIAVVVSMVIVLVGLTLSYIYDLPSGATIVLTGIGLLLASLLKRRSSV